MGQVSTWLFMVGAVSLFIDVGMASAGTLEADLARCLGQPSWFTRVQCYDRVAKAHGIEALRPVASEPGRVAPVTDDAMQATETAALSTPVGIGQWRIETAPGLQPGSRNVWLMLTSINAAANHTGEQVPADLALRCLDQSLDVMVWAGGSHYQAPQPITYQVDSGQIVTLDWGTSSDAQWAFHPAPRAFIDAMVGAGNLHLSLDAADAQLATYTFSITGLAEIVDQLRTACPRT